MTNTMSDIMYARTIDMVTIFLNLSISQVFPLKMSLCKRKSKESRDVFATVTIQDGQ